jgi:ankyrin repeat protein/tetratricopeptide (TPR) repeat protein
MLVNGHSPSVVDGKFCTPILYASLQGDWRLVVVLRSLYLAPFWTEEGQGSDFFDDTLVLESIRNDDKHVLVALLLLNAPLASNIQEIVIESERIHSEMFPSSLIKAFELKNQQIFRFLIQGCFCHSIINNEGSFEKIVMNLKRAFVCSAQSESVLDTPSILHRLVETVTVLKKHQVPATCTESQGNFEQDKTGVRNTSKVPQLTSSLKSSIDAAQDAPCDITLKSELEFVETQSLTTKESVGLTDDVNSHLDVPVHSYSILSSTCDSQFCSDESVFQACNTPNTGSEYDDPVMQSTVSDAVAVPSYCATIASGPTQEVSCEGAPEDSNQNQMNLSLARDDEITVTGLVHSPTHSSVSLSSPVHSAENGHYAVKESVTLTFDAFELDIDPEYRNIEAAVKFEVQDVLPVLQVEDRIGNSFLNACKLGLDEVLICLVNSFSVDSIFNCSQVAGGNPLHLAVSSRSLSTVEILLKWRPSLILEVDKDGRTPLHAACGLNFHAALSKILNSASNAAGKAHRVDLEGDSCLTLAVKQGACECVELLALNENDALIAPSKKVPCALELSLTSSLYNSRTFLRLFNLCSEHAVHSFRSSHDNGLLHVAVKYQRIHSICAILQRMGEGFAQVRDSTGRTAVEIAASSSNKSMFNILVHQTQELESAANQCVPDAITLVHSNQTYFGEADTTKPYGLRCFPGGNRVSSSLIDQIYSCVMGDSKGSGMLHLFQKVVASGNSHILGMPIFKLGPQNKCTCLHLAAGVNSVASLQFVLDHCSRCRHFIDLHNSDGLTACAVALIAGNTKCVKLLLQQGSRIVTENQCETEHSMRRTTCNLLHICAKHCHDSSIMEQLIDFSSLSNIISLDDSNQSLLHICAHVNNIHAYSAIASKAPHAVFILINHRDDLGNTALHVCSSNSASLNMAHALMQSGCYTHMRNYDADLPYDIAVFMGNIDIAQVTRVFKSEECVKSNFRSRCDDYVEDLVKVISHDKASEISQMCKSPLWIGSWLRVDFMSSATCAQKASSLKMATALSDAGFCAMSSPKLVEHLLGMMLKNENATIVRSLEMMFANCSNLAVSLFLMHQFPTFLLQVASEKNLDDSIFCWVVKNWTRPSVCDQNGSNALQLACQTENAKFLNAVICHLEETSLRAEPSLCDQEVLLSYKTEIMKSILSRNAAGHSFIHMTSGTSVANQAEKILSLVACKSFLRMDAIPADSVLNVLPQHHLTLVSLGMIESLFQEADFDVELTKLSRDRHGRCLLANACISGQVACVSSLLEKGLSPSLVDCEGRGILHHAVLNHKNDIIYFIIQRFPQKIFELDSTGRCLLHQAIRNGSDEQSLSTLKELQKNIDKSSFLQLCLMSDHSKRTAVEEALLTEKYDSGMFMLQIVMLYCGSFSANPIHVFEVFVMDYINKTFQVVSEFNVFMTKICTAASAQNSLMSFLNVFCSEPQHPLEHDDVLQPQNIESAKSSVKVLNSDLKSSSFCSGQWVCLEETFSEHFLVSNDTSSTKASLVQIFSSIYDHPAFSNCVRPSVSESLMAHSFRLNWILQDGVSPVDCERMLDFHSELIRHFLVLERLSLVFYSKIQTNCRDQFLKLTSSEGLHKTRLDQVSESTLQDGTVPAFDSQKLNAIGIYPPIASNSPDATELFALVTANNFEGIMSCIRKSTKHLTLSLDSHKNTLGHAVAFFCSLDVVEKLIDVGLHVDLRNDSGQMPFHFACLSGRFEVARVLFRKMKSTDLPLDSYGHSLLHFAALSMNENCVSSVQTTCHIAWDSTTSRRQTALDLVLDMEVNPKHSVCILLTKGEALAEACNSKLVSIQNALQSSLITSCRLDLQSKAACCVNAGADIRVYFPVQADDGGHNIWNAIDVCAAYNSASVMKSIFDCVTNDVWLEAVQHSIRNRQRNQLPSSLWVACKHMSLNSLKFLLENGSNLMEEDDSGLNIFAFCIKLRCDDSLSQLLHFCSANYADVFLRKFVLAPDKMGLSCIEHAIQERHPHAICILREFLLGAKLCDETEMIVLGQKYLKLLCYSRYDVPRNPCSTFQCIIEVIKFFHTDFAQALMLSYRNNNRPLESCRDVGRHDSAVLLFTLHLLAQVNFDGKLILDAGSDHKFDSSFIVLQSGSSTIWNALQLIERILHAFTGRDSLILRYLSAQVEKFIAKLDDDCINSFSKLVLLSMNEPKSQDINAWEHFYRRVSKAFDEELSAHDAARHAPYSMMNFTTQQNELLDAIYRGDSSALNNHILKNPSVYLDPTQSRDFHNQCYMAAVHGDQEHILEFLVQKGFQYSQISGDENLLMLASRLGRSTIIRGLSRRPCLDLDVNYSIADGACALHLACARNFSDTLRSLVSNFPSINVNALNAVGESAVSLCVKYSHISVLETMIENLGIPEFLSVLNASGQNFFHEAASADNPVILQAAVAIMLKMLNQTHVFGGKTPSCDLLKSLVETTESVSQPDVSHVLVAALLARDVNGDTPAHVCIRCRSVASLAILIRMCPVACVVPNVSGSSPLHVAVSRSLFSIDLFRLLISAAKSLGPWIFDDESMQQLVEEHCVAHASVMAALCHFEDAGGSTVWDIAFAENADAKSLITKFINLCRQNNPQKPHIPRLIESSILKTLFLKAAALPSQNKRKSKGLGSIYLGSIDFLQNILHRCKLNRWYIKQLEKRNYEAGRCLLSSLLLQRSWRRHVASKNMTAAKFLKTCYIRIQSSIRNLLSRRVYMFRKNLHEQLARVEQSRLLWNAYERFSKRKFALTNFQASTRLNFEYRNRCSISGAVQLQAAIMSHHLYLLRKHYAKKNAHFMKITAAATLQRVFRGREGRRLFSVLRQMSEQDQCVILPTGRKLRVHKYSLLRLIRRAQCAVRYLLAKRQLSVQYFSKNGLKSCCLIQRAWTNHFCRVQVRRARANIENLKLSALASRIQKCFRSKLSRIHFKTSVEKFRCFQAAVALQCALRCRFALQLFRLRADGAVLQAQKLRQVQDVRVFIENESLKIKRERVERHLATLKNKAATVISSLIRGVIVRSRMVYSIKEPKCLFQNNSSSAEKIQQVWLRHCALRKMRSLGWSFGKKAKQTVSAKRIVSYIKTRLAHKVVSIARKLRAVIILQKMWRVNRSNAACHKIRSDLWDLRLESKATKIQAVTKAHWVRKSFVTLKSSWPQLRELRISKKVMQQLFTNFQKSKFHKIVLQALMKHKNECIQKIQCAFRSKIARNTCRCSVSLHNMSIIVTKVQKLQKFWRRCSEEKRFCSKLPWMLFPWPSADVRLEASSWSVVHAYDVRLEGFMQSKQFDDYEKSLSAACQFGMRQLQEVPDDAAYALQSLVRFAASMCETALYHGNKKIAFSLASRAVKLMGTEKNKFVLNCTTEFSAWVLDTLAHVLFSRGLFSHALSLINEAIVAGGLRSSPDSNMLAILHFHKGLVYQNLGNVSSAKDNFSRACQLFHNNVDNSYSLHFAASYLALSSMMSLSGNYDGAALNCSVARGILSKVPMNSVHETFFPPSMCWRFAGLLQVLRRFATSSDRFIQSALLKIARSRIPINERVQKSRARRFFNRPHLFPKGFESWTRWSCRSFGAYGIIPEKPNEVMVQKFQKSRKIDVDHALSTVAAPDSGYFREYLPFEENTAHLPSVQHEGSIEDKLKGRFRQMHSAPVLIHPWHIFNESGLTQNAFQDFQFILSSCLDVSATTTSQQRWLKLLEYHAPDGQLPSFVKDLVTHAPSADSKCHDSVDLTSVKSFSASPNPMPRKDIVSCLNRVMLSLLQRACLLWHLAADGQGNTTECKDCVQLLKDMLDNNMNSLKRAISKTWKYVIVLCDAVLFALSENYSEAFNLCMRVHDGLQKSEQLQHLEFTVLGLASCNAVYCLWHFQKMDEANISSSTTVALVDMLNADVKLAVRMGLATHAFVFCLFHNLGHISVESGEYLRAFRAWGEAHKTLETASQRDNQSISEIVESFTSNVKGVLKSSKVSIENAISTWLSIKELVSSAEYRCNIQNFISLGMSLNLFAGFQLEYKAFEISNKLIKKRRKNRKRT